MGGLVLLLLLLAGVMLCLGILVSLPASATDLPSAYAGAEAAQEEVDGRVNAPSPDGSYSPTPPAEVKETNKHPVNASVLTMLVLCFSLGASVLWMLTNERRRAASCLWGVEDRPWLAVAYEGSSFLGVFLL
jgi:hypothetical protein